MKASVSVVIPHYNALDTIGRSLDSVVNQTLGVSEVIVVDDGSPDVAALSNLLASYSSLVPIEILFLGSNQGAASARNAALKKARFKYIAFLDSDDVWHPQKIELQYTLMEREELFLSGHGYIFNLLRNCYGRVNADHVLVGKSNFLRGNPFFTPTVMVRREKFVSFDERFRRVDDYKCWYENLHNGRFGLIKSNLAAGYKSPVGESGLSGSLRLMHVAYLSVLKKLYIERHMGFLDFLVASILERMKYPLRIMLVKIKAK
ncbi:glycosyltransferase family 2 protein [Pseudomonas gingeri]